jgi:peptidyl-prolyl cis-trans isomerase B (cyclophilin B)
MAVYAPLLHESIYTPRVILHTSKGRVEIHLNVVDAPWSAQSLMTQARQCRLDGQGVTRVDPGVSVALGPPPSEEQLAATGLEVGERPFGRGSVYAVGDERGVESIGLLLEPAPHLDGVLTQVGWVASGMEVLDTLRAGDLVYRAEVWDGR